MHRITQAQSPQHGQQRERVRRDRRAAVLEAQLAAHARLVDAHAQRAAVALALEAQRAAVQLVVVAKALQHQVVAHAVQRVQADALVDAEEPQPQRRVRLELPATGRARCLAQRKMREADLAALEHDAGPQLAPRQVRERARRGRRRRAGVAEVPAAGAAAEQGERQRGEQGPHFQPPTAFFAASFSGRTMSPVADTLTAYCAPSAIGT